MGAAAIEPALAAIERGVIVALANKECVVAAGAVFHDALERSGASVIPASIPSTMRFSRCWVRATPAKWRW